MAGSSRGRSRSSSTCQRTCLICQRRLGRLQPPGQSIFNLAQDQHEGGNPEIQETCREARRNLGGNSHRPSGPAQRDPKAGLPAISDFGFNVMNAKAASAIFAQGIERATVSVELRTGELKELLEHHRGPLEAIVGGNLPLLITKHCPLRSSGEECSSKGCRRGSWHLEDRMGEKFPLLQDGACRTVLYNSHMLSVLEELPAILKLGLDVLRIGSAFRREKGLGEIHPAPPPAPGRSLGGPSVPGAS